MTNALKTYAVSAKYKIYSYKFIHFIIDMTRAPLVPKHRILTEDEANNILDKLNITANKLPKITDMDPQSIWLGARPGDVIEITRLSKHVGYSIAYRYCIPTPAK